MIDIAAALKAARAVSTPLIGITTADAPATVETIRASYKEPPPMIGWDAARGFLALNEAGKLALSRAVPQSEYPGVTPGLNLAEALTMMQALPERAMVCVHNAHLLIRTPNGGSAVEIVQGILNLRDTFKSNQRTLVLLAPALSLPLELQQDVMILDEPLPSEAEIRTIIDRTITAYESDRGETVDADDEARTRATEALSGLSGFPAEQSAAISIREHKRLDLPQLWNRKAAFIEQTRGLKVDRAAFTLDDIGGLDAIKGFARQLFDGPEPPRVVVRIDEGEKAFAGASGAGESSGTAKDALGVVLSEMEEQAYTGLIAVGPPGAGKTLLTTALARSFDRFGLVLDIGATRGSLVGQSEEQIRQAMKILRAVAGPGGAYFVMTCNALEVLPPELKRRFTDGTWFFDLPTPEELRPIWTLMLAKYGVEADVDECLALSEGWTGAEVRNVARNAYRLRCTVAEAARYVVPVVKSDPEGIERLRKVAESKFLSASYPGLYQHPATRAAVEQAPARRRFMEN